MKNDLKFVNLKYLVMNHSLDSHEVKSKIEDNHNDRIPYNQITNRVQELCPYLPLPIPRPLGKSLHIDLFRA